MSFTDFLENKLLDHVLGGVPYVAPDSVYLGLSTTTPTDAGTNFTEPSGAGYARVEVENVSGEWPAASGGAKTHANGIVFPQSTGSWGTVTHFGIFDAETSGNLLMTGALSSSKLVSEGDVIQFSEAAISVRLS